MIRFRALLAVSVLAFASTSQAQPESFTGIAPGSYPTFMGFTAPGGIGSFSMIGTGGLMVVDNGMLFPPASAPNAMFGRGVDVQFRLLQPRKMFRGRFRSLPFIATPPTFVFVRFYLTSLVWTPWFAVPINTLGYTGMTWDIGSMFGQGFWMVQMVGNGSLPGYVGMDDLNLL
ncbi:MAG: hypothetical protein H6833_10830 [Planctomycetes bacterium]|nr:hypothetical protein [Planctomycetota bacterium]